MAKSPAFQFYYKDWRSSRKVQRMSFKERGMYLELLIDQWDQGPLPIDPAALADQIGAPWKDFEKAWPRLRACFVEQDGGWVNARLEEERQKQIARQQRAEESGRAGAAARYGRHSNPTTPGIATAERPNSFAFASAVAPAGAGASAASPPPPDARSKRPIFTGQQLTVFEWQVDDLAQMLGPKNFEAFDLHAFFFALDERVVRSGQVLPRRDGGAWLQAQVLAEATRRGLSIAVAAPPRPGPRSMVPNAEATRRHLNLEREG